MKPWHDGWRWLVACVVIGALPLFNGPARSILLGFLAGIVLLTLRDVRSRPEVDYSEWREES